MHTINKYLCWLLLFALLLTGCEQQKKLSKRQIITMLQGKWTLVGSTEDTAKKTGMKTFLIATDSLAGKTYLYTEQQFFPAKTLTIRPDSLLLKDTANQVWRLKNLTPDSLVFVTRKKVEYCYTKQAVTQSPNNFDQIILSTGECDGSCPVMSVSLNKKGELFYYGQDQVSPLGFYRNQLPATVTAELFATFEKITIGNLQNKYIGEVIASHLPTFTTSFIKNGKIIKAVDDYGGIAAKLRCVYKKIPQLYANNKLKLIMPGIHFPPIIYRTRNKTHESIFLPSESFLLWIALRKSKPVKKQFKATYQIAYDVAFSYLSVDGLKSFVNIKTIKTNGQYFSYIFKDGTSSTYDLGYDFFKRNLPSHRWLRL